MKLILMASNNGHLLDELYEYVTLVITDKPHAPIVERATKRNIHVMIVQNNDMLENVLKYAEFDHIIMCGYLKILPKHITNAYSIFNTHPSLLPAYAGMHGRNIHEAVIENGDQITGVSLHKVNEIVDGGEVVTTGKTSVSPDDNAESLEQRIKAIEKVVVKNYFRLLE